MLTDEEQAALHAEKQELETEIIGLEEEKNVAEAQLHNMPRLDANFTRVMESHSSARARRPKAGHTYDLMENIEELQNEIVAYDEKIKSMRRRIAAIDDLLQIV